ncbi:hypothetical protein [Lederbergia lenta]|uniref:hypothetical protein n=1 Tax=Lederbergia lenta TaxID=1467 RepID=UPI00203B9EBD|nr:hypothetical protein [Lederbergia lenta]MCM3109923.1 hypothetical protein [Lederbergia lenta]
MSQYKKVIAGIINSIHYQFPGIVEIQSDKEKVVFKLYYHTAEKVAKYNGWLYYFGTEIKYGDQQEFHRTFKELLKVKRALIEIHKNK